MGRFLLRGDLLEGQRDGFCHVIYGRSSGIANCGSRLCVSITAIRPGNAHLPDQLAHARLGVLQHCDRHACDIVHLASRSQSSAWPKFAPALCGKIGRMRIGGSSKIARTAEG
jgi:hypothetical protein